MCDSRESANLSRIRESVANLSRTRPTRCELVQTLSRNFANPSRICVNLRKPGGELSRILTRIRRESHSWDSSISSELILATRSRPRSSGTFKFAQVAMGGSHAKS
eukprot:837294-Prymnesium_polylepis.1